MSVSNQQYLFKDHLAHAISGMYQGDLVISETDRPETVSVKVEPLSDLLVRVSFEYDGLQISLRGILSEEGGDVHMIIQELVTDDFILNGVRGFLCQKPNVHGGYISQLSGFYFHILFNHFSGPYQEFYFFGKPTSHQAIAV
jgi:hypothetical protein